MQVKLSYSPGKACITAMSGLHGWNSKLGAWKIGSEDASYKPTVAAELKLGANEWINKAEISAGACVHCELHCAAGQPRSCPLSLGCTLAWQTNLLPRPVLSPRCTAAAASAPARAAADMPKPACLLQT